MGASMRIAVIAQTPTFANEALVRVGCHGASWSLLTPAEALYMAAEHYLQIENFTSDLVLESKLLDDEE